MCQIKTTLMLLFVFLSLFEPEALAVARETFKFHLFSEPQSLSVGKLRSSNGDYFFSNIMRGLYQFSGQDELKEDGGKCQWKNDLLLACEIFKSHRWQNNKQIVSTDYLRSFQNLLDPNQIQKRADLLFNVKNAKPILAKEKKQDQLGFKIIDDLHFNIEFEVADYDFLYKLSTLNLRPTPLNQPTETKDFDKFISSGPYQIKSWSPNNKIVLSPNPNYKKYSTYQPEVEIFFIADDKSAYRLYQSGKLNFLRRLTSDLIDKHKNSGELFQVPMARFDYIGFLPTLYKDKNLISSLNQSINFSDFKKLFKALGAPGCPSISESWLDTIPCYQFNLDQAKKNMAKANLELREKKWKFAVSKLGGDDISKIAEFFQDQWKKNVGFKTEIDVVEQSLYLNNLEKRAYPIFRKGIGLDIPTCFEALYEFSSQNKQTNYTDFNNTEYEKIISKWPNTKDLSKRKQLCTKAIDLLLANGVMIPMGRMYFSILAKPKFKGWSVNSLNQLDLAALGTTID